MDGAAPVDHDSQLLDSRFQGIHSPRENAQTAICFEDSLPKDRFMDIINTPSQPRWNRLANIFEYRRKIIRVINALTVAGRCMSGDGLLRFVSTFKRTDLAECTREIEAYRCHEQLLAQCGRTGFLSIAGTKDAGSLDFDRPLRNFSGFPGLALYVANNTENPTQYLG